MTTTPSVHTGTRTIEQSFEELHQSARSVGDVTDWFREHPELLIGDALKMLQGNLQVTHKFEIADAVKTAYLCQRLAFDITVELNTELVLHDIVTQHCPDVFPLKTVGFKEEYSFELPLKEWPFATALITGMYLRFPRVYAYEPWSAELEQTLDECLVLHFEHYSFNRIRDLYASDLLPLKDGLLDVKALVYLLCESKYTEVSATLPCDIMMP